MNTTLVLRKFSPDMIGVEEKCLFIGKTKSGKTTAALDIAYHFRKTPEGAVFCGTADGNDIYEKIVPDTFIYSGWKHDQVQRMIKYMSKKNKINRLYGRPKEYCFLFLDDLGWDDSFCADRQLKKLLMNGRHWGFAPMMVMLQYPLGFKPAQRGQFDWIFLFRDALPSGRRRLHDHYAGMIGDFKHFCDVFDSVTENYGCMVIHNTGRSTQIEDTFFWWKATIRDVRENKSQKAWHMGDKTYWQYHFENYDVHATDDDDDSEDARPKRGQKRKFTLSND